MRYALLGCGYHARGVASVLISNDPNCQIAFIDPNAQPDEKILGFPVLTTIPDDVDQFVAATGYPDRLEAWSKGLTLTSVISRTASIGPMSAIAPGCFIGEGAFVGSEVKLGFGVIVNTHAIIEHNAEIGPYCNICPGATVLGQCKIGDHSFVGARSVIKNNVHICANVIIGMGAVVIHDITEPGTYVGNPAQKINNKTVILHVQHVHNS